MGVRTVVASAAAPLVYQVFSSRRNNDRKGKTTADSEAQTIGALTQPLLRPQLASRTQTGNSDYSVKTSYGAVQTENANGASGSGRSSVKGSPERLRRDSGLDRVPEETGPVDAPHVGQETPFEEADEDRQWDLEEAGLYEGSFPRLVALYTIIPIICFFIFLLLALLPRIAWPSHLTTGHHRYLPFPYAELLVSISLWSLSHLLRVPLFTLISFLLDSYEATSEVLSTTLHVILQTLLRIASFALLSLQTENHAAPRWADPAFLRVWWLALGWALADVSVGIVQGYSQLALYQDVLVSEDDMVLRDGDGLVGHSRQGKIFITDSPQNMSVTDFLASRAENGQAAKTTTASRTLSNALIGYGGERWRLVRDSVEDEVDRELETLNAWRARAEYEEIYGIPLIKIPVFVSCLQRIDSIILSFGLTFLLAAAYLRSAISLPAPSNEIENNHTFYIVTPVVALIHLFLAGLYTSVLLPRIGVHTAAYIGLLVGLSCLFSGLGMWGALS